MNEFQFGDTPSPARAPRRRSHLAALVLAFGVSACVAWILIPFQHSVRGQSDLAIGAGAALLLTKILCPILAILAVALGLFELTAMRALSADNSGQGGVLAGLALGLLAMLLFGATWLIERAELSRSNREFPAKSPEILRSP